MNRLSYLSGEQEYAVTAGQVSLSGKEARGAAIDRLARYEDFQAGLIGSRQRLLAEMERLRQQGRQKSYQFRELMGQKAMYTLLFSLLEQHGLGE